MRVLALDTTTERESVAVVEDSVVRGEVRLQATDAHSRHLVPAIAFVLETLGIPAAEVDGFALTLGPGSFTGVRIGLGTVQGLALASGKPCLGVSTLEVLAALAPVSGPVVAVMDAYRGEVFAAVYEEGAPVLGPYRAPPEQVAAEMPRAATLLGDGALRYRPLFEASDPEARFATADLFLAAVLGLMAEPRLVRGEGVPPEMLRPLYLREAEIRAPRR